MTENFVVTHSQQLQQEPSHQQQSISNLCCRICGIDGNLRRCSKCKSAYYCCQDHQKLDWKEHKPECKIIQQKLDILMATSSNTNTNSARSNHLYGDTNHQKSNGYNQATNFVEDLDQFMPNYSNVEQNHIQFSCQQNAFLIGKHRFFLLYTLS
jgi:hypothetical protein